MVLLSIGLGPNSLLQVLVLTMGKNPLWVIGSLQNQTYKRVTFQWVRKIAVSLRWWEIAGYFVLILLASLMRFWNLGSRAIHHDESLHAYYSWQLASGNGFKHDPMMHGPLQFESMAGIFFVFGDSDFTARLLYAIVGVVLVALPCFFRSRLGRISALILSAMLAFSPTMLYYSRFARNDILMAAWTLGLVICMWKYIDEGRNRHIYIGSFLLALAFATKESAYLVTFIMGLFMLMTIIFRNWPDIKGEIKIGQAAPPLALWRAIVCFKNATNKRLGLSHISPTAGFLVVLFTLTLPLGAALLSTLQNTPLLSWTNLVLASPAGGTGPIGAPLGGGLVVAFMTITGLLWIAAVIGFSWDRLTWLKSAIIFYGVLTLLYTTFFTNFGGIGTGSWQSLGYWLAQQGEARGDQPWYYYIVLTPIYEFLPLFLALLGGNYYIRRRDKFGIFLVYWAVATFVLYTIASEKMPWLLVNISLPIIVLGAKFLGDIISTTDWRILSSRAGLAVLLGTPTAIYLLCRLALISVDTNRPYELSILMIAAASTIFLFVVGIVIIGRMGLRRFGIISMMSVLSIMAVLSVRTAWNASYRHGDIPVEMIVYTQTSPHILSVLKHVEEMSKSSGDHSMMPITIDSRSGFSWPWAWYLRNFKRATFVSLEHDSEQYDSTIPVQVVHVQNQEIIEPKLGDKFGEGVLIKHRWWFPEDTYRSVTPRSFVGGLVDRGAWRSITNYLLYRKLNLPLGSEDAYVYFDKNLSDGFELPAVLYEPP